MEMHGKRKRPPKHVRFELKMALPRKGSTYSCLVYTSRRCALSVN
jgi:hypothetical protein